MHRTIKFWKFGDGSFYTTALDIENHAGYHGGTIRQDPDGTRHPGSVCNRHIKFIKNNVALRKHFNLDPNDCIQIDVQDPANAFVIQDMLRYLIITQANIKSGRLDLYTQKAAEAIISCILQTSDFKCARRDIQVIEDYKDITLKVIPKRFDKVRERVDSSTSLFSKNKSSKAINLEEASPKILSMLKEDEPQVSTRRRVRVTPKTSRGGIKR